MAMNAHVAHKILAWSAPLDSRYYKSPRKRNKLQEGGDAKTAASSSRESPSLRRSSSREVAFKVTPKLVAKVCPVELRSYWNSIPDNQAACSKTHLLINRGNFQFADEIQRS